MNAEDCRHFYGRVPTEDFLDIRRGDDEPCICDFLRKKLDPKRKNKHTSKYEYLQSIFSPS